MSPRMFLFVSLLTPIVASGASAATCPSSGYTASSGALSLTSNCTVTGNISLSGTATMTMTGATLTVAGNVTLAGSSALTVTNGELAFPQHSFNQYAINLSNNSQMTIDNSTVSTNLTGANQFTVTLTASNSATLTVTNSSLLANSHILGNFNNTSTLIESGSTDVPTEVYPTSQAKVTISGGTFGTLWLDYKSGNTGTINLPVQSVSGVFSMNTSIPSGWSTAITSSVGGLGVISRPGSHVTINGNGLNTLSNQPSFRVAYWLENNTSNISINGTTEFAIGGCPVTKTLTDQQRTLTLKGVCLSNYVWQIYTENTGAFTNTITGGVLAEVGVLGPTANLTLANATVQTASLDADKGKLTVTGTDIWALDIRAIDGGILTLNNTDTINGSLIAAQGAGSVLTFGNAKAEPNGLATQTNCDGINGLPPNIDGVPLCNVGNPLHACPVVQAASGGASYVGSMTSCTPS